MNIVFDLDGTLIDSRRRLYELFQILAPTQGLSFSKYWALKRQKISNEKILSEMLGFDDDMVAKFVDDWMRQIETPEFLALDTNFPGMHQTLSALGQLANLHVCTARQSRAGVLAQLERLELRAFFASVLVTEQRYQKEWLIRSEVEGLSALDWLVGDTGADIVVGKSLGMRTCAVLTGFLSEASLRPYGPDRLLESAAQFSLNDT
jgi:phosphoglycolate phosphatase